MKQKKITISGIEFTFQKPSLAWLLDMKDSCKEYNDAGIEIISNSKFYQKILDNVVVNPKMSIDDFDKMENGLKTLNEVIDECERFLMR